jgi:hypothetical protein
MADSEWMGGSAPQVHVGGIDQAAMQATYDFACSLVRLELSDADAVVGIRTAAGDDPAVLSLVAESLRNRAVGRGDPLLARVGELAGAAASDRTPRPLCDEEAELLAAERHLVNLPLAEAFNELARRDPRLLDIYKTVTSPGWADSHRRPASRRSSLRSLLVDRFTVSHSGGRISAGTWPPCGRPARSAGACRHNHPGVGADVNDPLLRTNVSQILCLRYLGYASGAVPAAP